MGVPESFNPRNEAANQRARLAHLDDGNDRAILVQGDEGSAQVVRLGHRGTPSSAQLRFKLLQPECLGMTGRRAAGRLPW
jgi:hypothetical protein